METVTFNNRTYKVLNSTPSTAYKLWQTVEGVRGAIVVIATRWNGSRVMFWDNGRSQEEE